MSTEAEEKALRYRRAQSVTSAEEITEKEKKARKLQFDKPLEAYDRNFNFENECLDSPEPLMEYPPDEMFRDVNSNTLLPPITKEQIHFYFSRCHTPRDSLFSWSSEFTNFTGLVNWGFLMLTIGGLRLCLENFLKYGFRVNPIEWLIVLTGYSEGNRHQYPSVILLIFCVVPLVTSLLIEKGIAVVVLSEKLGVLLQVMNILFVVALPVAVIHYRGQDFSFVGTSTVCTIYLIVFLKLWSYVQTNHWCRHGIKGKFTNTKLRRQSLSAPSWNELINAANQQSIDEDKNGGPVSASVKYPENLNLRDLFYFLLAPTLCYELNFPRTTRIRKVFLIKRLLEVIFGVNLVMALFQQWMIPSVQNTVTPFSEMDYVRILERMLKLAVPNHLIWLCFFYLSFHSFLNLMGELLHFSDRNFYNDWWNANNIAEFWRNWNMPVHRWAVRHVYSPVIEMGYSKGHASLCVFIISALFHEYLVSVPLQMFRVWAFLGMMAQLPLSIVSRLAEVKLGPRWGNLIVWSSLILGQPLAIMMYYHDYALKHVQIIQA